MAVVVCTAGRPDLLVGCLDAVAAQEGWEAGDQVVVVANGTDRAEGALATRTHALAGDAAEGGAAGGGASGDGAAGRGGPGGGGVTGGRTPELIVVEQAAADLAAARNLGASVAGAEMVVYLDDDARPAPGWLRAWHRAAADHPEMAVAGGPIRLVWPRGVPPRWFHPQMGAMWGELELGPDERVLSAGETPFGANLAVRRDALARCGGFRVGLGRAAEDRGGTLAGGEDTELARRLASAGGQGWWIPDATVDHLVGGHRARLGYVVRRAWSQGSRTDPALGASGSWTPVLARGWARLGRDLTTEPRAWRRHLSRDLSRRVRLAGRARAETLARKAGDVRAPSSGS